jgi:hypothetical protein
MKTWMKSVWILCCVTSFIAYGKILEFEVGLNQNFVCAFLLVRPERSWFEAGLQQTWKKLVSLKQDFNRPERSWFEAGLQQTWKKLVWSRTSIDLKEAGLKQDFNRPERSWFWAGLWIRLSILLVKLNTMFVWNTTLNKLSAEGVVWISL